MAISQNLKLVALLKNGLSAFMSKLVSLGFFSTEFKNTASEITMPFYPLATQESEDFDYDDGYEDADVVVESRTIDVNKRKYQPYNIKSADARRMSFDPKKIGLSLGYKLSSDVLKDIFSIITEDNFPNSVEIDVDDFDASALIKLGTLATEAGFPDFDRGLILNSAYFGNLKEDLLNKGGVAAIGVNPLGEVRTLDNFNICEFNSLPENDEDLVGVIVNPQAILFGSAPIKPDEEMGVNYALYSDPKTGLTIEGRAWGDKDKDKMRYILECNYGFQIGDPNAIIRIVKSSSSSSSSSSSDSGSDTQSNG